jgi:hypothetical protein
MIIVQGVCIYIYIYIYPFHTSIVTSAAVVLLKLNEDKHTAPIYNFM